MFVFFSFLFVAAVSFYNAAEGRGDRKASALDPEIYAIVLEMVEGNFKVPVNSRTKVQKAAYMYYWRNKRKLTSKSSELYLGKLI